MSTIHAGSCLCGAVRFEVEGDFEQFYLCHCRYCQKDSGSAHAANLFSSHARLNWLGGAEQVTTFTLPSTRHCRSFCASCGAALPSMQGQDALLVVPAGSLDTAVTHRPQARIFVASRAAWDHDLGALPELARLPG